MDELDLLKKRWKRQEEDLPTWNYDEIYKILLKKSSSIVKWIFFISVGEILLWTSISLIFDTHYEELGLNTFFTIANTVYYGIFLFFIYLFFKNYRTISATNSIKELMQNIMRTLRTVKFFILYNILGIVVMLLCINIYLYVNTDLLLELSSASTSIPQEDQSEFLTYFFVIQFIAGALLVGLVLLFYRVIYGIFLRRLNKNYKKLKELEQ